MSDYGGEMRTQLQRAQVDIDQPHLHTRTVPKQPPHQRTALPGPTWTPSHLLTLFSPLSLPG
ncbi:hypothetical protein C8Q80DRAFT_1170862 [Daedaleopsis nitida]|nr:hypothetical protein C8Q80DRAFT_1170862 [Daedaleopsis nitida]